VDHETQSQLIFQKQAKAGMPLYRLVNLNQKKPASHTQMQRHPTAACSTARGKSKEQILAVP